MGMRVIHGLFAAMAAAAAAIAMAPSNQPLLRPIAAALVRRFKGPRRARSGDGRKTRAMNAKNGVGKARLCPTMRAIEEKRRAKVAARALKAAA